MLKIPYGKHFIDSEDIKSVVKALKYKSITQGPLIEKFEKKVAKFVGSKYAIAVSSASAGLHLSLMALDIKKGHKVITSPVSFVSTSNSILHCSAKPIFCDIDNKSLDLDLIKTEIKIDKKVKAIIQVHLGGAATSNIKFKKKLNDREIKLIEDAAHSFGSKYECGSRVGSCKYSDLTIFSFHPVKTITTGEGGIITTNSKKISDRLKILRSHGINKNPLKANKPQQPWFYEINNISFNYKNYRFSMCFRNFTIK